MASSIPAQAWEQRWVNLARPLSPGGFDVVVSAPAKAGKSMATRHVNYLVTTSAIGADAKAHDANPAEASKAPKWMVRRRFSDFEWLRGGIMFGWGAFLTRIQRGCAQRDRPNLVVAQPS